MIKNITAIDFLKPTPVTHLLINPRNLYLKCA